MPENVYYSYTAAMCNEQCSLHGGVCDNGICEFRCSDYAGYTCQNRSMLLSSLSICRDVLAQDSAGRHCAPSEPGLLQQLEVSVVKPNYSRLLPSGWNLVNILDRGFCSSVAKRLACWVPSLTSLSALIFISSFPHFSLSRLSLSLSLSL